MVFMELFIYFMRVEESSSDIKGRRKCVGGLWRCVGDKGGGDSMR